MTRENTVHLEIYKDGNISTAGVDNSDVPEYHLGVLGRLIRDELILRISSFTHTVIKSLRSQLCAGALLPLPFGGWLW